MKVKNRVVFGIASLLLLVGAIVVFSPFNSYVKRTSSKNRNVRSKKFSLVDVNKASMADLEKLPGIGSVKAAAIVNYRKAHGLFVCAEDLTKVSGIGKATLEKFKSLLVGFTNSREVKTSSSGSDDLLDVNKASVKELESLPMIGPVKAKAIVSYRKEHGPFHTLSDLRKVKGIGDKTLMHLRGLVVIK